MTDENKNLIQEIKTRTDILEVGRKLIPNLKQSGRVWIGTIRNEKTPALTIYPTTQSWTHFAGDTTPTGKNGGDVISLVEYVQNCSPREAIQFLTQYIGMNNADRKAQQIWDMSVEAPADFPYLDRKHISPHGARFRDGKLVLPLYASDGTISSIQFIASDGGKKFLAGAKVAGCYFLIGNLTNKLCIAEGFATAASIYEATGYATAVAYSEGNLKATAEEIQKKYPATEIIICADADTTGLVKAKEAAETVGARLAVPVFDEGEKTNDNMPTDFNDLHCLQNISVVKAVVDSAARVPQKYGFTSLRDLLNEPEEKINWVVDDLLPAGGFSIMVAKPKVGKSTLARQLALSVARGESFLGRKTVKGLVLYISLEEKRGEVKNHFKLMGAIGIEDIGLYVGATPEDANKWLERAVEQKHPVLIIVDTLFRFARVTDLNDYAKTLAALTPLLSLARDKSAHVMGIHHARKSGGDGADTTLGSTAIFGTVDTAIVLKKDKNNRTIETEQRYGTNIEPTIMIFDEYAKIVSLGGTKVEMEIREVADEILDLLKTKNIPLTEQEITEEVEGRTIYIRTALRALVDKEDVKRTGFGKRGNPYLYSCFLVPNIEEGRAEQETKSGENTNNEGVDSCSEDYSNLQTNQNKEAPEDIQQQLAMKEDINGRNATDADKQKL